MSHKTPFFQAFGPLLFGRPGHQTLTKLGRRNSLQEVYELFGHLLPERLLATTESGANSRERLYSQQVTFWAFVAQILSPGTACREMVRRVEAWWQERSGRNPSSSSSTSAYCQARARLEPGTLELIRAELAWSLERNVLQAERGLGGRPVKIVDGTGISMPDTLENQQLWPQPSEQRPGCGFPALKLVGLFSLSSGALLEAATGNLHVHEGEQKGSALEIRSWCPRPGRPAGGDLSRRCGSAPFSGNLGRNGESGSDTVMRSSGF